MGILVREVSHVRNRQMIQVSDLKAGSVYCEYLIMVIGYVLRNWLSGDKGTHQKARA